MGYDLGKLRSTRPRRILFVYNRELSSLATNPTTPTCCTAPRRFAVNRLWT